MRHIAAKVADEDFRRRMAEAGDMKDLGVVQVVADMIIRQMGIEVSSEARQLAGFAFIAGHVFGRDLGSAEGFGFPS